MRDGVLVGYQLDRAMGAMMPDLADSDGRGEAGRARSNGCAYADSPGHVPVQRMANVSLQAAPDGPSTEELIARVERGIYVVGDKSWSIDMQRFNFQFTGQRFYAIRDGELDGQLRDVAYQATTTDFWGSMEAVGGPQTWVLGGAFNCGKAQPGQVASVSHGCSDVALPRRHHPQHRRRRRTGMSVLTPATPQTLAEHALAASSADDCVVVVADKTSANLRWANNTLTTNGVMHTVSVSVVSFVRGAGGVGTGSVTSTASSTEQVAELVAAADAAARAASPAEDAADLVRDRVVPGLGRRPGADRHPRLRRLRARARRGLRDRRRRGPAALRVRQPRDDDDLPGVLDRPAPAPRPAQRPRRLHRQERRPDPQRLGRRRDPRLHRRRRPGARGRARPAAGLGRAARRPARPAATTRSCRPPRSRT